MPPPKTKRRLLTGPAGLQKWADPAELEKHGVPEGYKLAGAQAEADWQRREEFGGPVGAASAAVIGGARGLTLGGFDVAVIEGAKALAGEQGADDMRHVLQGLSGEHEAASMTGEVASLFLGGAAGKGAGLGTKLLRATPLRGAVKAGEMVERGVLAARPGSKLLAGTARAGTEGALFGAGQAVSHAAIMGNELTGEDLAASIGMGGGIGAGAGLALGVVGKGMRAGGSKLRSALRKPDKAAGRSLTEKQFGHGTDAHAVTATAAEARSFADAVAEQEARAGIRLNSEQKQELFQKTILSRGGEGKALRDRVLRRNQGTRDELAGELPKLATQQSDDMGYLYKNFVQEGKPGQFNKMLPKHPIHIVRAKSELNQLIRHTDEQLADVLERQGEYGRRLHKKLRVTFDEQTALIDDAIASGDLGAARTATERYKRLWDGFAKSLSGSRDAVEGGLHRAAGGRMEIIANKWRGTLESSHLWGKAGPAQAALNRALSEGLAANRFVNRELMVSAGRDLSRLYGERLHGDPSKFGRFIDGLVDPKTDLARKYFLEQQRAYGQAAEVLLDTVPGLSKEHRSVLQRIAKRSKTIEDKVTSAEHAVAELNQAKLLAKEESERITVTSEFGGTLKQAVGGAAGAVGLGRAASAAETAAGAAGAGLGHAGGTIGRARKMYAIETLRERLAGKMDGKLAAYFGRAKDAAGRAVDPTSRAIRLGAVIAKDFEGRAAQIRSRSPEQASDDTKGELAAAADAQPEAIAAAGEAAARRQAYQAAQLPPELSRFVLGDAPQLHPAEIDAALRRIRIADDPLQILEELDKGTLDRDAVNVMKRVWPAKFQQLQRDVLGDMLDMAAEGKTMPYYDRLQLDTLLDLDVEPTLDPDLMAQTQMLYAQPPVQPPQQQPPPPGPVGMPDRSEDMMTDTQRLAAASEG